MKIIFIYNLINFLLFPFYVIILLFRLYKDKENISSLKSRLSIYTQKKTKNRLIWLHGASVGESIIIINLVNELRIKYPLADFLITTGTLSSTKIVNKWLPDRVYHEFLPLDNFFIVRRFYQHWQPELGIFIESELWPTLLSSSQNKCKLILLNARLSDKSFARWLKFSKIFKILISYFSFIAVQSKTDLDKYHSLVGPYNAKKLMNLGNLKFTNQKLTVIEKELSNLRNAFKEKKVFVASSTHPEDEEILLKIIRRLKDKKNSICPIIIVRHPERREELKLACKNLNLTYSLRSENISYSQESDVYIVDSFGELGLFYSLADVTFVGGSFKRGGHNLLEPAYFDNVIILGPDMTNFQNITDEMIEQEAVIQVKNEEELERKILFCFEAKNEEICKKYSTNAKEYVKGKREILSSYLNQIANFFHD